jgi:3-hydroxybutyrate dehydrogenase
VIEGIRRKVADEYKVRVAYSGADMSKAPEIAAMIAQATKELGGVDILVNNAGIQHTAPVRDFPAEQWEAIIAINLFAAFYPTQAALPYMLERNWGRVINIASRHGLVASAQKSAYVAAKHGIVGFTKVVALETATTGVTCNAICPGWVLTPLVQKQIDVRAAKEGIEVAKAKFELLAEKQPSHEFCYPRAAWILCSVSLLRRRCTVSGAGECDRWGMDSTVEQFCEVAMRNKITSAAEAVAIVQNGDAVCSSGFVGIGVPDALLVALEKWPFQQSFCLTKNASSFSRAVVRIF